MTSFFKSLLWFIAAIVLLITLLSKTAAGVYIDAVTWIIFAYFIVLTTGFHYGLMKFSKGDPKQFVRYYMGAKSFKLLFHLGVIVVYCLFNRAEAVRFIITFALFYFAFTVFEFTAARKSFNK